MIALLIIGALFGSFMLSRTLFWVTKRWHGGYARILVIHASLIAACLATLLAELRLEWASAQTPLLYVSAQTLWLIVDLFAHRGRLETQRGAA